MKHAVLLATVLLGSGCSSAVPSTSPASEPSIAAATPRTSLGTVRTRDREMTLYASPTGVIVTVRSQGGALVADQVDLDALRSIDPHLYDIFRSGTASRPYLDATLDGRTRTTESREPSPLPEQR